MKNVFIALLIIACGCQPEDTAPTSPVANDIEFDIANATLLKKGMLMGVNHDVTGTVSVYVNKNERVVVLDPFSSQNGPDLKIYISKDAAASEYLNLGALKSTMGMQTYSIPANIDISKYGYVHVWCEKFSVEFARAQIVMP